VGDGIGRHPGPRSSWRGWRKAPRAVGWTGPTGRMPSWPRTAIARMALPSARAWGGASVARLGCAPIARRIATSQPTWLDKLWPGRICGPLKKAEAGVLVLLSQDEARFSMTPTLRTTLGLKGHRPVVGHLDCHGKAYVFGALKLVTGHLRTRIVERRRDASAQSPLRPF
jgi:hypothetical protein